MRIVFLFLMIVLSGCTQLKEQAENALRKPEIVDYSLSLQSVSFEEMTLMTELKVSNPGQINLAMLPSDYRILVNNQSLVSGTLSNLRLPAGQVSEINVPVTIKFSDLKPLLKSVEGQQNVNLRLDSLLKVQGPLNMQWTESLSLEKQLPVPQWPVVGEPGIQIEQMNLSGFRVLVHLPVMNPNSFGISLNGLNALVSVGQMDAFNVSIAEPLQVAAGSETRVGIPVELSWNQASRALLSLLQSGRQPDIRVKGNWELEGTLPGFKVQQGTFEL
ncbi:LEA type 2 family protein [Oceanospirillum sediminis]|uniref:LEA type 2 family protein n=1 Tax=Oceanospirillum sediminis TaxID=2760088 RepID=A0A839IS65_9GAMM|nr:LEA type 2 family protein [Oceanospirillum sediminis]MBB1487500.1 LEA type 2 family protein [Oceanospirillum sediminis]